MADTTTNYNFYEPIVNDPVDQDLWGGYLNFNFTILDGVLNTRTQDYNFADLLLIAPEIKDYSETKQDVTAAGSTTIDISAGNVINLSHGTNISVLAFTNPSPTGKACSFTIRRIKDNSATARTITWPASVKVVGGVYPTLTQTAIAVDILVLQTVDAGTRYDLFTAGLDMR